MGCGVACLAFVLDRSYRTARRRIIKATGRCDDRTNGITRKQLFETLNASQVFYRRAVHRGPAEAIPSGAIVLVERFPKDHSKHYVVRHGVRWMDPLGRGKAKKEQPCEAWRTPRAVFRRSLPKSWRLKLLILVPA